MFMESEASSGDRPWKLRSHSPVRIEYRYGPLEVERSPVRAELESANGQDVELEASVRAEDGVFGPYPVSQRVRFPPCSDAR